MIWSVRQRSARHLAQRRWEVLPLRKGGGDWGDVEAVEGEVASVEVEAAELERRRRKERDGRR